MFIGKNKKIINTHRHCYQPSAKPDDKTIWLNKIETILSIITSTFTGTIILTGDTNINIKEDFNIKKWYTELLQNLPQHTQLPTKKSTKTIDHIITNIPNEVIHSNILLCSSISDHDAPYIIAKNSTPKYQTRYEFIRDMAELDMGKFKEDFKLIPFWTIRSFDNPGKQLAILNKLILHFTEEHFLLNPLRFLF